MNSLPKSICSNLWTSLYTVPNGSIKPCCEYAYYLPNISGAAANVQSDSLTDIFVSDEMKRLRETTRNGEWAEGCYLCKHNEETGLLSKRQFETTRHMQLNPNFVNEWQNEPEYPFDLSLIFSPACNLKCRSCGPQHSTMWRKELNIRNVIQWNEERYRLKDSDLVVPGAKTSRLWIDRFEWYKGLRQLSIYGGEPFFGDQWITVIQELVDLGYSEDIDLKITTNGTYDISEIVTRFGPQFKFFNIGWSIDGVESTYEYMRNPGKWSETCANLLKAHDLLGRIHNFSCSINCVVSWLNATNIIELDKFIISNLPKFNVFLRPVNEPYQMNLTSTTRKMKNAIAMAWQNYSWSEKVADQIGPISTYMWSEEITESEFNKNLKFIIETDKFRGEDIYRINSWLKDV